MVKSSTLVLRRRIIAIILLTSLLPLGVIGFGAWTLFGRLLEKKAIELTQTLVQSHTNAIESYLAEKVHLLQTSARTRTVAELSNSALLRFLFDNLNQAGGEAFADLGVIASDGRHLAYVGPYDLMACNYSQTDWFREVMREGSYTSDVFLGFRNVPHIIIAIKVDDSGNPWILRATINSSQFDTLVRSNIPDQTGNAYIVNLVGRYQTTPRAGSLMDKAPILDLNYHSGVASKRVIVDGAVKIRTTTWVNERRWMLVVEQNLDVIQAPVNRAIIQGAMVALIAVLVLTLTTFLATSHLSHRLDLAIAQRDEMQRAFLHSARLASVGELATGLAHEINNPLAIIGAEQTNIGDQIQELEEGSPLRQNLSQSTERIRRQVQRCGSITRRMLQFGRKTDTAPEPTDITLRLKDITDLLQRQASSKNISLILEFEPDLPQVRLDPVELEQIILNLVNNSFDALPNGGQIQISAKMVGNQVQLSVKDNGVGIPARDLERVFEPFFTTKPPGKGTGLGLPVCYGMVRSCGGTITVASQPGAGTTVTLVLPIHRAT